MTRFLIISVIALAIYGLFYLLRLRAEKKDREAYNERSKLADEMNDCFAMYYGDNYDHENLFVLKKQDPRFSKLLTIDAYRPEISSTTPTKLYYTSATVGGITTGGFHTTGGDTYTSKVSTDRFRICFLNGPIGYIRVEKELMKKIDAKAPIRAYISKGGYIQVIEKEMKASWAAYAFMKMGDHEKAANTFTMDNIDRYPDMRKCETIVSFLCGVEQNQKT